MARRTPELCWLRHPVWLLLLPLVPVLAAAELRTEVRRITHRPDGTHAVWVHFVLSPDRRSGRLVLVQSEFEQREAAVVRRICGRRDGTRVTHEHRGTEEIGADRLLHYQLIVRCDPVQEPS